jgi:hypothetical protein
MKQQRRNLRWAPWYTGDPAYAGSDDYPLGSIGCVTGFLVNMVERSVQLISPCTADNERPNGSIVFAEDRFNGPEELAAVLDRMIAIHMAPDVPAHHRLSFHDWLRYEEIEDGIRLAGRFKQTTEFRDPARVAVWRSIGARVRQGGETAGTIVHAVATEHGVATDVPQDCLRSLLQAGVLDECRV